jgi:tetratricopeptide (TPR) repeat protein
LKTRTPKPAPTAESTAKNNPSPVSAALPGKRKWAFRLAALAMPLVFLALLEGTLRLLGYGYPMGFFLQRKVDGRAVLIDNDRFACRYFPPALARSPQPCLIVANKPPDTTRIFVLGESAAMGDPEPAYGVARTLEVLLRARHAGQKFEVVNVAVTAINSHVIRDIARECAGREGDIWIIYMGNNEVVGPFGAGTVFGAQAPRLGAIRASVALKAARAGQLADAIVQRLARRGAPTEWAGMEMFLDQQVRHDAPRMAAVYDYFQRNLEDILHLGQSSGATVLLSTVVSNLKDCPPFASQHQPGLSEAQLAEWTNAYEIGASQESASNFVAAIEHYQQAARIDASHAELQFRLGRCLAALGEFATARQCFERARDFDTLRFRADTRINELIRQAAARRAGPGLKLVDAAEDFARLSTNGLTGEEFLYEHVHLNSEGNYLLARLFAEQIAGWLRPEGRFSTNLPPLLTVEECARRLALTEVDRFRIADEMMKRLQEPPFTKQLDHALRIHHWRQLRATLKTASESGAFDAAAAVYREALSWSPDDWVLRENFAKLLQDFGELSGAEREWRRVLALMPHYEAAHYSLGNALDAQGKPAEALACFRRALELRPDSVEAINGLALALAGQQRVNEAVRLFKKAILLKPAFVEARVNLGQTLAREGRVEEAKAQYLAALRHKPEYAAAHINLGKLLAERSQPAEATAHYREAVRVAPDNAVAHYNLGNALNAQGSADALQHYAEAVRLDPAFAEARYNLALGLAKQGANNEALQHFSEVVRLRPQFVEAHLNLGVALAKERRFAEAVQSFEEVLRLDPQHENAGKYLDQAKAMLGRR